MSSTQMRSARSIGVMAFTMVSSTRWARTSAPGQPDNVVTIHLGYGRRLGGRVGNGKGFDASRVRGLGLVGMNERVSQLGGVLEVESDPVRGTSLRVDLPLPNASVDSGVPCILR